MSLFRLEPMAGNGAPLPLPQSPPLTFWTDFCGPVTFQLARGLLPLGMRSTKDPPWYSDANMGLCGGRSQLAVAVHHELRVHTSVLFYAAPWVEDTEAQDARRSEPRGSLRRTIPVMARVLISAKIRSDPRLSAD